MKITICGSIAFFDNIKKVKIELEQLGHTVQIPPTHIIDNKKNLISVEKYYKLRKIETNKKSWIWDAKTKAIKSHFNKIKMDDCILVLNYSKNNIENYIGANTFLEMGVSLYLNKPIYLLNPIPNQENIEELLGMKPIIINNNLKLITKLNDLKLLN